MEIDLALPDGRTLHAHDSGQRDALAVFWHHGTPGTGALPVPLLPAAERLGIRWVALDRPGYGGSSRQEGRSVRSVAADVAAVADALEIERFAVLGASGGGPHSLACAAVLGERVAAAVSIAGLAPFGADGLDWFAGMGPAGEAELKAAAGGPEPLTAHLSSAEFDPEMFTPADHETLAGPWGWLGQVAGQAMETGLSGMVDDDLAFVTPWGFDVRDIAAPVLFVHGEADRVVPSAHSVWLAGHCRSAELRLMPGDGHISVLRQCEAAMEWVREHAG